MIAAATIFAASAFFALRLRNRRGSSLFSRFGSPREKSLIVRGIENGGLSLIALAVQRLGTRGLDHLMATDATAEKSAEHERPGVRTDDVRRRAPV
jgi:hypothetical protein